MNTTSLPSQIRECVDGGTSPVTFGEIRVRAVLTDRSVRRGPARRRTRLGVAAAGLAAAGVAGALVASQSGGGTPVVFTAAALKHVASASRAAMTSGRADILWTSGPFRTDKYIMFDGANSDEVLTASVLPGSAPHGRTLWPVWNGSTIRRLVDGKVYMYPAWVAPPKLHFKPEWARVPFRDVNSRGLEIPDPRSLLGVLSPSAGFVSDGYTTVDGVRLRHLRATKPGAVPLASFGQILVEAPPDPGMSALDLWVDPSDVVVKVKVTVTGAKFDGRPQSGTATVTFSQIGQPQDITAPAHYITDPGPKE